MDALIERHRRAILRIARTHGADRARVFGSMPLGCAHENSDVDLLVDLQPGRSLLDLIAIKQVLQPLDELQSGT
jgi:predicted nucleotidyltransferase